MDMYHCNSSPMVYLQLHVESQTSQHSLNHELLQENMELKAEIERLHHKF